MLANVFAKTLRDRWLGWAIAAGVVGSFVVLGMLAYEGIDLSVMDTFPEAYRSLLGLQAGDGRRRAGDQRDLRQLRRDDLRRDGARDGRRVDRR